MVTLFSAKTTNTAATAVIVDIVDADLDLEVYGTFDGGSFTLERLAADGSTYIAERDESRTITTITSNEIIPLSVPYGSTIRGVLSGGGGSMSLNAVVLRRGHKRT